MWSLQVRAEVEAVNTRLVANQGVVGSLFCRAYSPNLDCLVERGRTKHARVLRIYLDLHDVVLMVHKRVNFGPVLVPIEHADSVIIRARQHVWHGRVHCDVANVVRVLLDRLDLLRRVVVEDAEQVVTGADDDPLFASDEFSTTHGRVCDLDRADLRLRVVVVDHDCAPVEGREHPG